MAGELPTRGVIPTPDVSLLDRYVKDGRAAQDWYDYWQALAADSGSGNVAFPATQVPSSDPNTLDDYEEGTWVPTLTFATPGDLAIASYTRQTGQYIKIGALVWYSFIVQIAGADFSHSTASGNLKINGIPFAPAAGFDIQFLGPTTFQNISLAGGQTQVLALIRDGDNFIRFSICGAFVSEVSAADVPSGQLTLIGASGHYRAA